MKYTVVKSREQYDQYCRILEGLLLRKSSEDEIELLTLLLESWDRDHCSIDTVDGVTILRYLIREHGLRAAEVADIVGVGCTQISDILNNKRTIPPGMALRLARHFKVRQEIFEGERKFC
jgi:HTH-type transcriptional regulator / antitoxin HigA